MDTKREPAALGKGQTGFINYSDNKPNTNTKVRKRGISLRKAINDHCKDCIYDNLAAGTWLQQVTICSSNDCPLFDVRPQSKSAIPNYVLSYYGIKMGTLQSTTSETGP